MNVHRRCSKCGDIYVSSTRDEKPGKPARCPICRGRGIRGYRRRIMLKVK